MKTTDTALANALDAIRSDPALMMAMSLNTLKEEDGFRELGGNIALRYVRGAYNPTGDELRLAEADRIIRGEEPAVYGMTFNNMIVNLDGAGVDTGTEFPSDAARRIILGIIERDSSLSAEVRELRPYPPF
ncbi:hypothetical protein [Arthrobacter caoxuetaonis]|uniref:Uncharacterized protein n=1 Tax=Arthrobacter caoxuetaonis TaxID=2886935 RepID=A0A9X1MIR1_9MICC|nr:hypothetical protein [Arthrobacter caoxuetaonis]MCC3299677.1 hypothetical protein [Arthrobacter caoxuetaonis]USQ58982.1 hypothetical protein NF551_17905 [Arthrobacter caoxuetaonis]